MFSMPRTHQSGNIMVYILLAIALFGALTLVLSRQNAQGDGQDLSDEQLAFQANELLQYSAAARAAVDTILLAGSTIDDIVFTKPNEAGYENTNTVHNIYHPLGGGLIPAAANPSIFTGSTTPDAGWYIGRFTNVVGTATSGNDIIITAYGISEALCGALNKKLVGSDEPIDFDSDVRHYLINNTIHGLGNSATMPGAFCTDCLNRTELCVRSTTDGPALAFYSVIGVQ
jgi:hypothetical protein